MVGHLIVNLVPGVGNLTIKTSKVQMLGGMPGGIFKLRFDRCIKFKMYWKTYRFITEQREFVYDYS